MTDIPFVHTPAPVYAKAEPQSPLVTRITARNPGPFTYTGTGTFLVGNTTVALIDPGPINAEHLQAIQDALKGKTLSHIFLTHHHADHSPLAAVLSKDYGCPVLGMPPRPDKTDAADIQLEEGTDPDFAPDIEISDGDIFTGPGWTLMALHTPGHTSNHICFALAQENTLFSGDHIMGWATSVVIPPDGDMGDYLDSLEKVKSMGFDILRPTHGPAITDVGPFIQAYIDHRLAREAQVLAAVKAGYSSVMDIVKAIYTDIDKRLYPAAGVSVLAHLTHLYAQKRVSTNGSPSLKSKFDFVPRPAPFGPARQSP